MQQAWGKCREKLSLEANRGGGGNAREPLGAGPENDREYVLLSLLAVIPTSRLSLNEGISRIKA